MIAEKTLADTKDHRPVTMDEGRKSVLFPVSDEPIKQFAVGPVRGIVSGVHSPKVLEDVAQSCFWHLPVPPPIVLPY
jgi:hypothetical protein